MDDLTILKPSELAERTIFEIIWKTRPKRSFISDSVLRNLEQTPFFYNCFCHVLAKGQNKWPYMKYYYKNIQLLTPLEHYLWDFGTLEQRINYSLEIENKSGGKNTCDWAKLEALADDLRKEYKEYFPKTYMGIIAYRYDLDEIKAIVGMLNAKYIEDLKNKLSLGKQKPSE